MNTEQEVLSFVRENDVKFIRLAFVDLLGSLKNIAIMASELPRALRGGISFDASSVKGFCDISHSELFLRPDPRTLTVLPWRPQSGRVVRMLCDCMTPEGSLFSGYSRTILRRMDEKALEAGCFFRFGTEYEFYLFEQDDQGHPTMVPQDEAGYMDVFPVDKGENVRREICLTLEAMGILPESSHHESGPGQNEIDFRHADPLTTADSAVTFKGVVRTIAAQYGLHASFMPKPLLNESGNGLHLNLSIEKGGQNLFAPLPDGTLGEEAQHAVAGILRRIRELSLFLNPIPSSYQRFGAFEAPKKINWSYGNRSQLVRIPAANAETGRMELRSPDPACNPYLAFSLVMAAALEGIAEQLPLQAPLAEVGELPSTMGEALALAESSAFLPTVIPQDMLDKYLQEKRLTLRQMQTDPDVLQALHWKTI